MQPLEVGVWFASVVLGLVLQGASATIVCTVTAEHAPVAGADVVVNGGGVRVRF
jgi:hypothetical protein